MIVPPLRAMTRIRAAGTMDMASLSVGAWRNGQGHYLVLTRCIFTMSRPGQDCVVCVANRCGRLPEIGLRYASMRPQSRSLGETHSMLRDGAEACRLRPIGEWLRRTTIVRGAYTRSRID